MDRPSVERLAELAKLRLTDAQRAHAEARIDRLLAAFEVLGEVATEGVEASPYPLRIPHRPRPDRAEPPLAADDVLGNAPDVRAGSFRVPRVVEG